MRIAIAGYNGLIGSMLCSEFREKGWDVLPLERKLLYSTDDSLMNRLQGVTAVINIAGAPIVRRWTKANRQKMYDSRILTTRSLVNAFHRMDHPPSLFISTSATGIYEDGGPYSESDALLSGTFLGKLCQDWEREAFLAEDICRLVVFRLGVVLDMRGGALARLLPFFRAGLGGPIGDGKQFFPWIHSTDLFRAYLLAIEDDTIRGVFNLTAPQLINNRLFTGELASVLHKPAVLPVPGFILSLLFGKGSSTLTQGQGVIPQRLLDHGFSFHFPQINLALQDLLTGNRQDI